MRVTVKAADLFNRVKEMMDDGMDFIEVSFMEGDDKLSAALHFEGSSKSRPYEGVDYEELDDITSTR